MASSRLTDPQKEELVARFSQGEASLALAEAYGVSVNTVSRVVRAALPADLYESLKQQRARGSVAVTVAAIPEPGPTGPDDGDSLPPAGDDSDGAAADLSAPSGFPRSRRRRSALVAVSEEPALPPVPIREAMAEPVASPVAPTSRRRRSAVESAVEMVDASSEADVASPDLFPEPAIPAVSGRSVVTEQGVLAIDDADDFGDDQGDEDFGVDDADAEVLSEDAQLFLPVAVSLTPVDRTEAVTCRPLATAGIHGGVYMLVDKTVELQPRALRDFSELGTLPEDEADRQAITVFINPREAKRQCGRSQRVIKMPDARLLERTAPYLLAQGISRVVVEGALYALPGS